MPAESKISEVIKSEAPKLLLGAFFGALGTLSAGVLVEIGGPVVDTVLRVASGKLLLRVIAVLAVLLAGLLVWLWLLHRRLKLPSTARMKFDEFGGYYIDPKTKHGVCTRCLGDGQLIHLMDVGNAKMCNACQTGYRVNEERPTTTVAS